MGSYVAWDTDGGTRPAGYRTTSTTTTVDSYGGATQAYDPVNPQYVIVSKSAFDAYGTTTAPARRTRPPARTWRPERSRPISIRRPFPRIFHRGRSPHSTGPPAPFPRTSSSRTSSSGGRARTTPVTG